MSMSPATALVPYLGAADDGLNSWLRLHPSERRRLAMQAARERDATALWGLTEAWLHADPCHGTVAAGTTKNDRTGLRHLVDAWDQEDLLRPAPDAAAAYVRALVSSGLNPGTIANRLATARGLYAALRWARAVLADPFAGVHAPRDPTPPWEKRLPYDDEVAALTQAATDPHDRVLVLLGAHAGECVALRWEDVRPGRRDLTVRRGKGGAARTVAMSATLARALQVLPRRADGYVLPYRTSVSAWRHVQALCVAAGIAPKGVHSLRHSAGTRLYAETGDLETTARHLGHAKLETTRVYAKWSDRRLRETIGRW